MHFKLKNLPHVDVRDETGSWLWNQLQMKDNILVKIEDDTLAIEVL